MDVLTVVGVLVILAGVTFLVRRRRCRDLRGQVVLLTGAGGGLGRVLALQLARRGCRLACVDIATEPNEETLRQVHQVRGDTLSRTYTTDLCQRDAIDSLVKQVVKDFGHIDILINNAGHIGVGLVNDLSDEEVDLVLNVNLRAAILLIRAVLPLMKARRSGQIVAISSLSTLVAHQILCVYAATKAGLSQFMTCVYLELRAEGLENDILTTAIHPGIMETHVTISGVVDIGGLGGWICPHMSPEWAAQRISQAIAAAERTVYLPDHVGPLAILLWLSPSSIMVYCEKYLTKAKYRPALSYQRFRHKEMDADKLHELLSKGYPLFEDPEEISKKLIDNYTAKGNSLPYDFSGYADEVKIFYKKSRSAIPPSVRQVFRIAS